MNKQYWALLNLFGEEAEGGNDLSDPTPQTYTGDNEASAPDAGGTETKEERQRQFRSLMEGEYKDLFTAYFQETFNRRFREQKEMKEAFERNQATLQATAAYLGISEEALPQFVQERGKAADAACVAPDTAREAVDLQAEIRRAVAEALTAAKGEMEQQILGSIRVRGLRPGEGALSDGGTDALQRRVGSLSRAERAELARRAAKGEEIKF